MKTDQVKETHTIKLTKHYSPEFDKTYYFIRLDHLNLYGNEELDKAQERFDHIIEIGIKAYLEEIRIRVELIREAEIDRSDKKLNKTIESNEK